MGFYFPSADSTSLSRCASFWRMFYLDGSSESRLQADLQAGIRSVSRKFRESTWKDALQFLASESRPWLLLFDNINHISIPLSTYISNCRHGSILITTRHTDLSLAPHKSIQITGMEDDEALKLLQLRAGALPPTFSDTFLAIIHKLDNLPHLIIGAGAYVYKTKRPSIFLTTLGKHGLEKVLNRSIQNDTDYRVQLEESLRINLLGI